MKLLLDEMFSREIASQLRARGHDVVAIVERADWRGLADPDVFDLGRRERRAVVTSNVRDFRPLHHESLAGGGARHLGMVFVPSRYRLTKSEFGRIVDALEMKLAEYQGEEDLAGGETWL